MGWHLRGCHVRLLACCATAASLTTPRLAVARRALLAGGAVAALEPKVTIASSDTGSDSAVGVALLSTNNFDDWLADFRQRPRPAEMTRTICCRHTASDDAVVVSFFPRSQLPEVQGVFRQANYFAPSIRRAALPDSALTRGTGLFFGGHSLTVGFDLWASYFCSAAADAEHAALGVTASLAGPLCSGCSDLRPPGPGVLHTFSSASEATAFAARFSPSQDKALKQAIDMGVVGLPLYGLPAEVRYDSGSTAGALPAASALAVARRPVASRAGKRHGRVVCSAVAGDGCSDAAGLPPLASLQPKRRRAVRDAAVAVAAGSRAGSRAGGRHRRRAIRDAAVVVAAAAAAVAATPATAAAAAAVRAADVTAGLPPRVADGAVLVVGATGRTGTEVLRVLRASPLRRRVVACTRTAEQASELQASTGVESFPVDLSGAGVSMPLSQLIRGQRVTDVICAAGYRPTFVAETDRVVAEAVDARGLSALVEAAEAAELAGRFVLVSSLNAGEAATGTMSARMLDSSLGGVLGQKGRSEARLRSSALDWCILRPGLLYSKPTGRLIFAPAGRFIGESDRDRVGLGPPVTCPSPFVASSGAVCAVSRGQLAAVCVSALGDARFSRRVVELVARPDAPVEGLWL